MTIPTGLMQVLEVPSPDNKPDEDYYVLALELELGNGFAYRAILPQPIIDEIIAKGSQYFISMQADGTALLCTDTGDNPLPELSLTGDFSRHDTLDDILDSYIDSAVFNDQLYQTRVHVRRLRNTLASWLEKADKALDDPFPEEPYPEEWKSGDSEKYRIE